MDQLDLTETIRIDTGLPFPHPIRADQQHQTSQEPRGETIVAEICSEFTDYRAQVEYFKKNGLIRLVHDKDSLPIVFSLDEDQKFCVLRHGTHLSEGWLCVDLTPVGHIATTFDVVQVDNLLYIAVACKTSTWVGTHSLFFCTVDVSVPNLRFENEAAARKLNKPGMQWTLVPDNTIPGDRVGAVAISSLLCKLLLNDDRSLKSFQVIVSTAQHDDRIATIYNVHTGGLNGRYWTSSSFPVSASLLEQTEPLILGDQSGTREEGLVSVVKDHAASGRLRCVGQRCKPTGAYYKSFEYKAGKLGNLRSAFSHLNIFGFTDVFIAAENGIGFFSWQNVDTMTTEPILNTIGFKQVVVSESEDPNQESRSKLSIFAVSDDDCLYFIEGTRDFSEPTLKYKFEASGFPIRKGVTHLAARFNASHGTNELLYASSEDNSLFFLRRVPSGASWVEDKITRRAIQHLKFDAFVTTMIWTDGHGAVLPVDYKISVTADSLHAVINGKGCTLSSRPVIVSPDNTGCVLVAVPSASKISCGPFQVSLDDTSKQDSTGKTHTFSVNPAQRTSRLLSQLDSPEKLRDAKSSTGQPVLAGMSSDQLKDAASLLGTFNAAKENIGKPSNSSENNQSRSSKDGDNWFDDAVDGVEKFLGDAIEMIKNVVKTGVKLFVRECGPVIEIVLKTAGTIIKWVVKGVFALLEAVGSGLELIFGWDGFSKLLKSLKLAVDPEAIAKTQKFLSEVITGVLKVTSKAIVATKDSLLDALADGGDLIKEYIDDPRVPARPFEIPEWIKKIFNNPFTRLLSKINPVGWVFEALHEEIPDLKLPDFGKLSRRIYSVFASAGEDLASKFQQLWETLLKNVQIVSADMSKIIESLLNALKSIFWSFWDLTTLVIEKALEFLSGFLDELVLLITDEWNIPGLTDAWEDLTAQKFTILRFVTFIPATFINMAFLLIGNTLPEFDPIDFDSIEIEPFYKSTGSSLRKEKLRSTAGEDKLKETGDHNTPALSASMAATEVLAYTSEPTVSHQKLSVQKLSTQFSVANIIPGSQKPAPAPSNSAPTSKGPTSSGSKPDATKGGDKTDDDDEWAMPHWYELVCEDIGKTYSSIWNSGEHALTTIADYKSYKEAQGAAGLPDSGGIELPEVNRNRNPQPAPGPGPAPAPGGEDKKDKKDEVSRAMIILRCIGKALQGGALIYATVANTRNAIAKKSKLGGAQFVVAVCGGFELAFFFLSVAIKKKEEVLNIVTDCFGTAGTVLRCCDDGTWDGEARSEFVGSLAVMGMNLFEQLKKLDPEPSTRLMCAGLATAYSVTDTVTSGYGVYRCIEKWVEATKAEKKKNETAKKVKSS